jgi:hypothetical protein
MTLLLLFAPWLRSLRQLKTSGFRVQRLAGGAHQQRGACEQQRFCRPHK